jgi:hypothetical protein
MRTAASFRLGGTSISACPLTILKVYKALAILQIQVLRIKVKFFKIKGLTFKGLKIKVQRRGEATAVLPDISGAAPRTGRRKYPRRLPPRPKPGMWPAIGWLILNLPAMALGRRLHPGRPG